MKCYNTINANCLGLTFFAHPVYVDGYMSPDRLTSWSFGILVDCISAT